MKKSGGIGIAAVIIAIIIIIGISYSVSSTESDNEILPIEEELELNESVVNQEISSESSEPTGKEFSVEFSESIGLKSP